MSQNQQIHPLAAHHLPPFITAPGETDVLLVAMAVFLVAIILLVGVLYFKLHALPEHLSHGHASKVQFEIVAVLALLALFTHNNLYWVAALLLAMIRFPDFESPLHVIANSVRALATGQKPPEDPMMAAPAPLPEQTPVSPRSGEGA